MDPFPGVPGGGHLRPLCGRSRKRLHGTAILGAVGFCDTRGSSSCLQGALLVEHVCSHRYVTLLRCFFDVFFTNTTETKSHRVVCVLNGWLLLFLRCFKLTWWFLNRKEKDEQKGPRLSFEVRLVYAVWCNQKLWTISFCAQDFLPGFLMERSWNM